MSGSYEQRKKRQAIKQIQQRSKRLANSHRNPFSSKSEENSISNLNSQNHGSEFISAGLSNNPFIQQPAVETTFDTVTNMLSSTTSTDYPTTSETKLEIKSTPALFTKKLSVGKRNPTTKVANLQNMKLLRDSLQNITDSITVTKFARKVGTCSYMCSEMEFQQRTNNEIYSIYETENGKFVHHLAVKEYKRSSADQEESKPEDLRPSIILLKTVQYLCLDLMDSRSIKIEDCYSYIWNRMRAIRKDITQQHLCDIKTVTILETIARFHILSAYLMAGENQGNFSQKHNNENLEKTLTSLRHIYADMRINEQMCSNEDEFRMYDILLNLNNGQIMHDVPKLSHTVFNSDYVQYALACYHAYNSNNYIRFFRLFRNGPFLSCCIIYRYLNNFRQRAFVAVINSNTTPAKSTHASSSVDYPIRKLQPILCYESSEQTIEFVKSMKVNVDDDNEFAILRNRSYEINQENVTERMTLIDSKIDTSWGRIIYTTDIIPDSVLGVPVPPSPIESKTCITKIDLSQITAHPQFILILDKIASSMVAQVSLTEVMDIITECVKSVEHLERAKIGTIKDILDEICVHMLREELTTIKSNMRKKVMHYTKALYIDLIAELINIEIKSILSETIIEHATHSFIIENSSNIVDDFIKSELNCLVVSDANYLSRVDMSLKSVCSDLADYLIESIISDQLNMLSEEAHKYLTTEKKERLNKELETSPVQKRYMFKIWKKKYTKIYTKRHTLDKIPPRIAPSSSSEVLNNLLQSQKSRENKNHLSFSDKAGIDLTSPTKTLQRRIDVQLKLKLRMNLLEEALSIKGIPLKCISGLRRTVYITIIVDDICSKMSSFLLDSFGVSQVHRSNCINGYSSEKICYDGSVLNIQIVDLMKASHQTMTNACKCCHVIILETTNMEIVSCVNHLKTPKIWIGPNNKFEWTGTFIFQPVSMTNMRCCNLYKILDSEMKNALHVQQNMPKFKLINIQDIVQSVVCSKITDILLSKQILINENKCYSVNPNVIISFYNSLIYHLSQLVIRHELQDIDWPSLFDKRKDISVNWNDKHKLNNVSTEIQSLYLHKFCGNPESIDDCITYVKSIKGISSHFLFARVSSIIQQKGLQWCLILNQLIHHKIENTLFINPYTVLLEDHMMELYLVDGEKMVSHAISFNELEDELADYQCFSDIEEDIAEMWVHLDFYESKLASVEDKPNNQPLDYTDRTYEQLDSLNKDIKLLQSNVSETELRLERIVNEGALPSYLMKSSLFRNM